MEILENKPLYSHTTMRLGGPAKYLIYVADEEELVEAVIFARQKRVKIITIGGGSNIVFKDDGWPGLVMIMSNSGMNIDEETGIVRVSAGENWDDLAKATVDKNLCGIEALSLIPGTVGASPINNIGAYGQEVKNTITKVRAYDLVNQEFVEFSNEQCKFRYRDSIFKTEEYGRFVITEVEFKLNKVDSSYTPPKYASVQSFLMQKDIKDPTPQEIREAIIEIRSSKLPDPSVTANAGSFFKNPIISLKKRDELLEKFPDLVYFDYHGQQAKLAAGQLIDKAGLKGYSKDGIKVYEKQALVLINEGTRSYVALDNMKNHIQAKVKEKFDVDIYPEPEIK